MRVLQRFLTFRDRVRTQEERYGWLFPVLAPLCLAGAIFASMIIPVIAHWDAVDAIEQRGGKIAMTHGYIPALGMRMAMFAEAQRVELTGPRVDDDLLDYAGHLRGLREVRLHATAVTDEAIERFRRAHPHVTVHRP